MDGKIGHCVNELTIHCCFSQLYFPAKEVLLLLPSQKKAMLLLLAPRA